MKTYDIIVIGGGAAGSMAAIRAGQLKKKVLLAERNDSIGRKILITGKGRCNLTNTADIDVFIEKFGKPGEFLRTAFYHFSNQDLIDLFNSLGLETKSERQGRVFPVTDKAASVIDALKKALAESGVEISYGTRINEIAKKGDLFGIVSDDGREFRAKKIILAAGGASYKATGSTGDGFVIAEKLGHKIALLTPGLVPLTVKEAWVKELQGVALENIRVAFEYGKKRLMSDIGELMFTHFGVSGPLVLDLSSKVMEILKEHKEIRLLIDLKPGLRQEQLESKLLHKFKVKGNIILKNLMKDLLPQRLVERFLRNLRIREDLKTNQVTQAQRRAIIDTLKGFPMTVTGSLPIEEAMVTGGGISLKEINPRTMESKLVPGLYFAGELIEGAAASGGYNLQQAFSTGHLAASEAAKCVK
ncbi:MAG: NAD(P)/FAD-dependent oxidoreductase [Candidatus Omnitrophica bacterium]|nr:NAD(P)/FAD-dependent oxidoreductase [Candidatus Omnitrophota bacterium]